MAMKNYLLLFLCGLYALLRANALSPEHLQQLQEDGFVPLSCNSALASASCQPWSTYVGTRNVVSNLVVIECGVCVEMDLAVDTLELQRGIDIQGKLVFPDGYRVEVVTPMIAVQGELHMLSRKGVDGDPDVIVTLVGRTDQSFTPINENADKCGGRACNMGKKSITVAGGKVNIQGLPNDAKSWTKLYDVIDDTQTPSVITVRDEGVERKWAAGAQILFTSYSSAWDSHQERTITRVVRRDGFVDIYLNESINRPTTFTDDPSHDFSVEVALLSRNIVFRGGPDANEDHGGHFWVFHTPRVAQNLDGVEFRNFGQQANLGRYPIHFHMCGDVAGSRVTRNTIRQSNQRCVVVHVTDNLLIQENVAYDTKGHCFMLEDGIETGNQFRFNLAAMTGKPRKIIPNQGANGMETDREIPSSYWITNLDNTFESNVAAGSEESGFWFETLIRGKFANLYDFEPNEVPLRLFKDNVAHSNLKGFRTYPAKALRAPDGRKNRLIGLKAYRNRQDGLFIHLCYNLVVQDSLFSDNGQGIDVDRADFVEILNTEVIGESQLWRQQHDIQGADLVPTNCRGAMYRGIQLHTFGFRDRLNGAALDGLTFEGFHPNTVCLRGAWPIMLDSIVRDERFSAYTTLNDIIFNDADFDPINFCEAAAEDVVSNLSDLDGSLSPSGSTSPGAVVTNVDQMLHFLPPRACTEVAQRCYSYCEGVCFRTITYEVPAAGTENLSLRVCQVADPSDCIVTPSYFFVIDAYKENGSEELRRFTAHLPNTRKFVASFVDRRGNEAWPTLALKDYQQDFQCSGAISDDDVILYEPPVSDEICSEIIKNGNMEQLDGLFTPKYWQFRFDGISTARLRGIAGTKAVAPRSQGGVEDIIQYLDSRCIKAMEGRTYTITAHVKLLRVGIPYYCDDTQEPCPEVGLQINTSLDRFQVASTQSYSPRVLNGYVKMEGVVTITREMAEADTVRLYVRTPGEGSRLDMFVDNVSMELLDGGVEPVCSDSLFSDIEPIDMWQTRGDGILRQFRDTLEDALAIELSGWNGMTIDESLGDIECLRPGSVWEINVRVKLINKTTRDGAHCLKRLTCPYISFEVRGQNGRLIVDERSQGFVLDRWDADKYNRIKLVVGMPGPASWDGNLGDVSIGVHGMFLGLDVLITGFSMRLREELQ